MKELQCCGSNTSFSTSVAGRGDRALSVARFSKSRLLWWKVKFFAWKRILPPPPHYSGKSMAAPMLVSLSPPHKDFWSKNQNMFSFQPNVMRISNFVLNENTDKIIKVMMRRYKFYEWQIPSSFLWLFNLFRMELKLALFKIGEIANTQLGTWKVINLLIMFIFYWTIGRNFFFVSTLINFELHRSGRIWMKAITEIIQKVFREKSVQFSVYCLWNIRWEI